MDNERFDALIRALGNGATRRGALGLLAGAAGLALGEAEARRRNRRGSRASVPVGKVTICHHDQDTNTWHPITISANALDAHAKHGDFQYDAAQSQCCTNADCGASGQCTITVDAQGTGSGTCFVFECDAPNDACSSVLNCSGGGCWCNYTVGGGTSCNNFGSCGACDECGAGRCVVADCCPGGTACVATCSGARSRRAAGQSQLRD
jgi:hypothetical protein